MAHTAEHVCSTRRAARARREPQSIFDIDDSDGDIGVFTFEQYRCRGGDSNFDPNEFSGGRAGWDDANEYYSWGDPGLHLWSRHHSIWYLLVYPAQAEAAGAHGGGPHEESERCLV